MFQTERTVDRAAFSERGDRATPFQRFDARWDASPIPGYEDCSTPVPGADRTAATPGSGLSAFGKRLAVVKAPAGFGKTSLAATWLEQLQQGGKCSRMANHRFRR
jgi:hypothetical protein